MANYKRILLLPMCGLGDAVCYLPFLKALRGRYSKAEILCFVATEPARQVLEGGSHNVEVQVFNRSGREGNRRSLLRLLRKIRKQKFDVVISGAHPNSTRVPLFAALSGATIRVGAKAERLSFLYNRKVNVRTDAHQHERFRSLLTAVAIDMPSLQYQPAIQPSLSARSDAMQLWSQAGLDKSKLVIGIASGADTNARVVWKPYLKRWESLRYAELVRWIAKEAGGRAVMFGGAGESLLAEEIAKIAGLPVVNFCGKTGIRELPWLLNMCKAVVANDTGVLQMAAAVGTPVVGLFGPTDALAFGPVGSQHVVLQGKVHCSPCYPHPTCDLTRCGAMDQISFEHVRDGLCKLLSQSEEAAG